MSHFHAFVEVRLADPDGGLRTSPDEPLPSQVEVPLVFRLLLLTLLQLTNLLPRYGHRHI